MTLFDLIMELETMETNADLQTQILGVKNDSRAIRPGDLFVAISGAQQDGHLYIPAALERGASAVVSERPLGQSVPHVVVPDSKVALSKLASAFFGHPSRKMRMIGVTGTNGKTTTTHIIRSLLSPDGPVGLIGTNHVLIGEEELPAIRTTPDAVELHGLFAKMVERGCRFCVMEVSSHALDQCRVAGIEYDIAVFTNLTRDHLDYHYNLESYFQAKRTLFSQCARAVINYDDAFGLRLIEGATCPVTTYSVTHDAGDVVAKNVDLTPSGVEFVAVRGLELSRMHWGTPGLFSVYNALAATATALELGLSLPVISGRLKTAPPVMGRMEVVKVPADFTVLIDYAHSPDSLENALSAVRKSTPGRVIAVFGCGGDRDVGKRPEMGRVAAQLADVVVVTSDNPRSEPPSRIIEDIVAGMQNRRHVHVLENRVEAIHEALGLAGPGDVVILCGKGHETYQEVLGEHYPMDEREIVAAFWRSEEDE